LKCHLPFLSCVFPKHVDISNEVFICSKIEIIFFTNLDYISQIIEIHTYFFLIYDYFAFKLFTSAPGLSFNHTEMYFFEINLLVHLCFQDLAFLI